MLASLGWLDAIGRSLRESLFMFWATLWPLILGFGLSGAIQAFVSKDAMRRKLGRLRPAAVARASGYGMASSSCSYAAAAMAKSLFARGADFVAAMVFMFASTNLVVELGIVLIVLMGWQFAASEFIGGFIMIVLLSLTGGLWLRGRQLTLARQRLEAAAETTAGPGDAHSHPAQESGRAAKPLRMRLRSKTGWADSATYTMADIRMLRKELAIGYIVAGLLATLVPVSAWHAVFLPGHGVWTSVQNAAVGPFIAIISFVCSIGNIPLAAALWHGGIEFGGVVSFIFADLITFPLLLVYRRYYGTRLVLRMLAMFWVIMTAAGLLTEAIFRAAGLVPAARPAQIAADSLAWNYTTYLNIIFLMLFGLLYAVYRGRGRWQDDNAGQVTDPVCGMKLSIARAPVRSVLDGQPSYFCSEHCKDKFAKDRLAKAGASAQRD